MTAIDRLVANGNSIISFLKNFSSSTPADVNFTWINDDDTTEAVSFKNIKKYQDEVSAKIVNYEDTMDTGLTEFKDQINTDYGTFTQSVADGAINATNVKYVDGKAYDKDDNEILVVPTLEDVTNNINLKYVDGVLKDSNDVVIPTQKTKEQVLADTNIQLVDGAILDKDGNIVPIEAGGLVAVDSNHVGTYIAGETWDEHTAYSRCHQYSKGQFAVSSNTFDDKNQMKVEMRIAPFQVDQETGQMTWGNFGYGYRNSGGKVHSTQSFGFCGNIGMAWGNSAWGTDSSHHQGGCTWRVNDDNTVTQGSNTGNTAYANDNTSNGMLALYKYSNRVYWNIPNGAHTSIGNMTESNASVQDWSANDEFDPGGGTNYIWRCVAKEVGGNHAGMVCNTKGVAAMRADGNNGTTGSYVTGGTNRDGVGFELENGKQVYFSGGSVFVRESQTGGCVAGTLGGDSGHNLGGFIASGASYWTGGYAAKEQDTFYIMTATRTLAKVRITEISTNSFSVETLGSVDFSSQTSSDLKNYDGLIDVTGNDDKFIVVSVRHSSYQPTHTVVYKNPMKDL